MPLDHVKLADGYYNSSSLQLGQILIWDTRSNQVENIYRLTPDAVPSAIIDSGPRFDIKTSTVSRDTKLDISASPNVSAVAKGEASAQFINATWVVVKNFNPREFRDASAALNSPTLKAWREARASEFNDPRFRYILITRVTDGDELRIRLKSSSNVRGNATVQGGQYKFKVSYNHKTSVALKANQAPLTVRPSVFALRTDSRRKLFYHDLATPLNFQTVKR